MNVLYLDKKQNKNALALIGLQIGIYWLHSSTIQQCSRGSGQIHIGEVLL